MASPCKSNAINFLALHVLHYMTTTQRLTAMLSQRSNSGEQQLAGFPKNQNGCKIEHAELKLFHLQNNGNKQHVHKRHKTIMAHDYLNVMFSTCKHARQTALKVVGTQRKMKMLRFCFFNANILDSKQTSCCHYCFGNCGRTGFKTTFSSAANAILCRITS